MVYAYGKNFVIKVIKVIVLLSKKYLGSRYDCHVWLVVLKQSAGRPICYSAIIDQGSFHECAQPMRDDVTL